MFREEIRKIPMDRKALRNFGLLMACVLLLVGGWLWWKSAASWPWVLGAAALLAAIGIVIPAALTPFYKGWMILAVIMGWVMTRVVLTLVYYLVLTPIGFLGRAFGEQFLQLKLKRSGETTSYWVRRGGPPREKRDYERQF
ncbi:MAG TPA: SxtJ family membrane protein [Syntrophales bacterium]